MEARRPDTHNPVALIVFTVGLLASIVATLYLLSAYLTDFIMACLFTGLIAPYYYKLLPKVWNKTWLASGLLSAVLVVLIALPASFIVTSLSVEGHSLYLSTRDSVTYDKLEEYLFGDGMFARNAKRAAKTVGVDYTPETVTGFISNAVGGVAKFLGSQVNKLLSNILAFVFHFALMVVFVFYFLIDGERLKGFFFRLSPLPDEEEALIATKFKEVGRAIMFGNGVGSLIQGILGGIAMSIAGIPSPILWGTVMTVFAFLPLVGISVVAIPATLYMLLHEQYVTALIFFAFCTAMGLFVENVVKTRLIGQHMQMHNLLIFMSIFGGLAVFGVLGILYGPLIVAFFLTMTELYEQHYRPHILARLEARQRAEQGPRAPL